MAIGERLPMVDATQRARGNVPYVLNRDAPGALVGAIARSQRPHARIVGVDTTRARALPGVLAVVTGEDVLRAQDRLSPYFGAVERDQPVLALDRVRYIGEPIAAVAAEDADAAAEAASLIQATYDELEPVFEPGRAAPGARKGPHGVPLV